jgi:hypothetical protein
MSIPNDTPAKKAAPQPSPADKAKAKYFELQLFDIALDAYKNKQYLKSAMMSWSFIEEFFLPTAIEFIAKRQKITFKKGLIENSSATHLIKYYYLISYDEELFELLNEARILRNNLVHKAYKSGSIQEIANKAKESAKYNLHTVMVPMLRRLNGEVVAPSLLLYAKGWNDMREKVVSNLDARRKELQQELDQLKNKQT